MADFEFLQNPLSKKWIILAPRRALRPDVAKGPEPVCPFCIGREKEEKEVYRIGGKVGDSNWQVRVLPNKFPFAPIHEIVILSPDHHKSFGELPMSQVELVLKVYRQRYNTHKGKGLASRRSGQVYIFHNHGESGGESLPHPHTQLAVIPLGVKTDLPRLASDGDLLSVTAGQQNQTSKFFTLFCPRTSQWPDEVWIAPKARGRSFGEIKDIEITDLAFILSRLIQIFDLRHGLEFPFNFYIYPGGDWYLRIIPRVKVLGGFETGTGIYINTQDPKETIMFIKEHFDQPVGGPNEEKIKTIHRATYHKRA